MFQKLRLSSILTPSRVILFFINFGIFCAYNQHLMVNVVYEVDQSLISNSTPLFRERFEANWAKKPPQGCPEQVIFLSDSGRLGNQILEYITTRIMATFQNQNFFVRPEIYGNFQKYFAQTGAIPAEKSHLNQLCNINDTAWTWKGFAGLNDTTFSEKISAKYLSSFNYPDVITVPTWDLMVENRDLILREFHWKDDIKEKVQKRIESLTANQTFSNLVAIHVRRTDYFHHLNALYGSSRLADKFYFRRAKAIYKQKYVNPLFVVFSDDMVWCKNFLAANDVVFAGDGSQADPGFDLATLSSFDHMILSYGTFAVTAAYFSGAEVVIADKYSEKPDTINENLKQVRGFSHWIWSPV